MSSTWPGGPPSGNSRTSQAPPHGARHGALYDRVCGPELFRYDAASGERRFLVSTQTFNCGWRENPSQEATPLPPGIASVLSVLSSSAAVLDAEDHVLQASDAARSFGLVEDDRLIGSALLSLARQLRLGGTGTAAGRGPFREPPGGTDPPGLRGQRQP